MRTSVVKKGDEFLRYEIREIVEVAKKIEALGVPMTYENIGDPVAKGEKIPQWMKETVAKAAQADPTYAYAPTKGLESARKFVLERFSDPSVCSPEDVIFFNGLGEAINKIFSNLPSNARVIGPNPVYPSHATAEAMHHGGKAITYRLDPENGWEPDLEELENKVRFNESVVGILVVNPNNPTGAVHKRETLEAVVAIAKKYDCFVIFDEIYQNVVFPGKEVVRLCDIVGDVPGISMKGISKEIPWPGSRCGWIEVYNADKSPEFKAYVNTILVSKMLEVASATLPQAVMADILNHPEYRGHFDARVQKYLDRAKTGVRILSESPYLNVPMPDGVFYLTAVFSPEAQGASGRKLPVASDRIREFVDSFGTQNFRTDKRFAYETMASEGVCVVPLSGFESGIDGFRMTLLEEDAGKFEDTCRRIVRAAERFFGESGAD